MNFYQFLQVLWARKILILFTLLGTVAVALLVSFILPPTYTATTSLLIDFKGTNPITGQPIPAQLMPGYMSTQASIIRSHNVALKVVDALKLTDNPIVQQQFVNATGGRGSIRDWLADILLKHLDVDPSTQSSLVNVSYEGADPQFATTIANAFAKAYITTNLQLRIEPAKETSAWLDNQTKILRKNLEQAQAKLSDYQQTHGIVDDDNRLDVESARLQEISSQLVKAQTEAYDASSRQRQMHEAMAKGPSATEALPEIINNSFIQNMKSDLMEAENRLADISEGTGKNNPIYQRAAAKVKNIRHKIDAEIKNVAAGISTTARIAQQRVEDLKQALASQKKKILDLTDQHDVLSMLRRNVDSAQAMLETVMKRSGQSRLESQLNQTDIAVLNPAVPPLNPSSPKILLNAAVAAFLGTLLGIGLAFLKELADRRVRTPNDVADVLGIPVLGTLTKGVTPASRRESSTTKAAA